jgi:AmmeMemoRadiSam system protein B
MNATLDVRPSPIAGQWYPGDPKKLAFLVDEYIQAAKLPEIRGQVIGAMAPHAGHRYSGPVAGYTFAALRQLKPDLVAVISPMHYPHPAPLLTTAHAAYATPLGEIPVDAAALEQLDELLMETLGYNLARGARDPEHSLEIELPFLQRIFEAGFKLLPVMVRDQSETVAHALGQCLAKVLLGRNAFILASTDLSHFYPQPVANRLDAEILHRVEAFDPHGVLLAEEEGKGFACGKGALAAVLWAAKDLGATQSQVLRHATSGDVTGDFSQVVGYGAAVFTRPIPA